MVSGGDSPINWVGDLRYVATDEGWVYLSGVSDACSRRLLGWSITDHLRTDGPLDALHAAVDCRGGDVTGVVFHSDKGCQTARRLLSGVPTLRGDAVDGQRRRQLRLRGSLGSGHAPGRITFVAAVGGLTLVLIDLVSLR